MAKICAHCKLQKSITEFHKNRAQKDGLALQCKVCVQVFHRRARARGVTKIAQKKWYHQNATHVKAYNQARHLANPDVRKRYAKVSFLRHKEKKLADIKAWQVKNVERVRSYNTAYYTRKRQDPHFRAAQAVSALIRYSLKMSKNGLKWEEVLGYTRDKLVAHLEKRFTKEMTWDNYGTFWEIDHIIPLSAHHFSTTSDIDFKRAWALSNLRPLTVSANRSKHAKLLIPFQPSLALGS